LVCQHCGYKDTYRTERTSINCHSCDYKIFISRALNQLDEECIERGLEKLDITLDVDKDKSRVVPWGDVHVGAPKGQCDWNKAQRELDYILDTDGAYMLGMGDYMDCAQKMPWAKGPNIYTSSLTPMQQFSVLEKALRPLAEAGKIIGLHSGNHEDWIMTTTGIQIIALLCHSLNVRFLGAGCFTTAHVGKQKYVLYSQHGYGGAQLKHTKVGRLINSTKDVFADVMLMGHVHQIAAIKGGKQFGCKECKAYYVLTGHFLNWEGGYAQTFGLDCCPSGAPKVSLFADRHDVHISI